ncbi:bacillithiol biosynthesis cysteine-adding enzyme BshC [bacterium]|nr:bacillithiol biosynthesis cysteine-adding enzyme BshC [bacterium]
MSETGLLFHAALPAPNRLVRDYLAGEPRACAHYGGRYDDMERVRALAAQVDKRLDRARVAAILRRQPTFGLTAQGAERLERFERQGGFVVTSGQQPVLFGGPLYILYKALTAVRLAARYEALLNAPVLPVFWNAEEDHDFEEMRAFGLPSATGGLESLGLTPRPGNRVPAGALVPGGEMQTVYAAFEGLAPQSEFRPWLDAIIHESYTPAASLGRGFGALVAALLGEHGLFVLEASTPELRRAGAELFGREAFDSRAVFDSFQAQCRALEAQGYPQQVTPLPGETNLFLLREGSREKLVLGERDGSFSLKPSGERLSRKELETLLAESPESFSPGVLLRPLLECRVLGSLAYVAGPGEISYYGQMGPLYALHALERPLIYPRLAGFVLEARVRKVLDKYSLTPADLKAGARAAADRILASDPALGEILARLDSLRRENAEGLEAIKPLLSGIDPTLAGPLVSTAGAISSSLERLEKRISSAARGHDQILLGQLEKAAAGLWPGGAPQERALAFVFFLARYGRDFISFIDSQAVAAAG